MDWDKIKAEYEEDIKYDLPNLVRYLMLLPSIISKYQNLWFHIKNKMDILQKEYNDTWISRFMYYKHDFDITLTNSEIKAFLEKDTNMNNIKSKIDFLSSKLTLVEKWLKNFDGMRFDLKLIVEWEKFKAGEY